MKVTIKLQVEPDVAELININSTPRTKSAYISKLVRDAERRRKDGTDIVWQFAEAMRKKYHQPQGE